MERQKKEVIILGSGPAGLTAAVYTARANLQPLLIHGPLPGGQLTTTTDVENYPGFPEGVMGPDLMQMMEAQAKRFGTEILTDTIEEISSTGSPFQLQGTNGSYECDTLIMATGAKPRLLGTPGEQELMGFGVSTCATCDGAFFRNEVITVIGGGDSACEEANFLTKFGSKVYLVHRRGELRASKIMADRVMKNEKIEIIWDHQLKEITGTKKDGVQSITLSHSETGEEQTRETAAVFIAIGHIPNSHLISSFVDCDENGYVNTAPNSTRTNIDGLFACGDLQDHEWRQAITAAGSGCMAALEAERWLEARHDG
ncbi:thioredoxin-disulfide reductase [bacterium]|nr:thioredoxin-disulfide reductase [bacterium]